MSSLDQNTPIPAKSLAAIQERNERALKLAEDPAWSLDQAEFDRAMLCAEVDRLTSERDKADEAAKHMGAALEKTGTIMQIAVATSLDLGNAAGMDVIVGYLSDAGMLPPAAVQADPQDGTGVSG